MSALVTLTSDFGDESVYIAAMKGALLSVAPTARIVDLSHSIPPQDVIAVGLFLRDTLPYFPAGCIHVVVVDPGVGTARSILLIEWRGSFVLAPDNGCWTTLMQNGESVTVRKLNQPKYWRSTISPTFHGRDIFAPVAGHLCNGIAPEQLGTSTHQWSSLIVLSSKRIGSIIQGEVVRVDRFGNLITNIPAVDVNEFCVVRIANQVIGPIQRSYGESKPGQLIALISSNGYLEIAEVNGSAAARLQMKEQSFVEVVDTTS